MCDDGISVNPVVQCGGVARYKLVTVIDTAHTGFGTEFFLIPPSHGKSFVHGKS